MRRWVRFCYFIVLCCDLDVLGRACAHTGVPEGILEEEGNAYAKGLGGNLAKTDVLDLTS